MSTFGSWKRHGGAALVAALLALSAGSAQAARVELTVNEDAFVQAINETRAERGLAPLKLDDGLVKAARVSTRATWSNVATSSTGRCPSG